MPQPLYSSDLAPADFFFFPKLKTKSKRKAFSTIKRKIKRQIETEAVGDTKERVSEVFRGLEKTLA